VATVLAEGFFVVNRVQGRQEGNDQRQYLTGDVEALIKVFLIKPHNKQVMQFQIP
jgi:hypothetical protein